MHERFPRGDIPKEDPAGDFHCGAVSFLHFLTPAGPHALHWLHLLYQKLYYVPILMAAAWFGMRGTLATAMAVSVLFLVHILWSWQGRPMQQADQFGEIGNLWIIALMSSFLFGRVKRSLAEVATANAETLAALASSLSYREAAEQLAMQRGLHFDPAVADAFLSIPFRQLAEVASRNGANLKEA